MDTPTKRRTTLSGAIGATFNVTTNVGLQLISLDSDFTKVFKRSYKRKQENSGNKGLKPTE